MTCAQYEDLIDKMSCRDIHPEEQEQLNDHIVTCRPCSTKYTEAKMFVDVMVRALHSVSATPDREQIARSLERVPPKTVQHRWAPWAVAASLLIAFAFVWLWEQQDTIKNIAARYTEIHQHHFLVSGDVDVGIPSSAVILSEMQKRLPFKIILPQYLPQDYYLRSPAEIRNVQGIHLIYLNKRKKFSLFEVSQSSKETPPEEQTIDGTRVMVRAYQQVLYILVSSDIQFDEMKKILDSTIPLH